MDTYTLWLRAWWITTIACIALATDIIIGWL